MAMSKQSRAKGTLAASNWALLAGIATAAATLFRYQVAIAGGAWVLSLRFPRRQQHALAAAIALAAGFGVAAAALAGGYWLTGHLDDFLFWGWRYNFQYIASVPAREEMIRFAIGTLPVVVCWLPAIVLAAFARRKNVTLAWLWLAAMCVALSIGGRFFGNYFLVAAPPLAALAGAGAVLLYSSGRRRLLASLSAGVVALGVVSTLAVFVWDRFDPSAAVLDTKYREAGEWIAAHSTPDDRIFVWGDSAQLYVYSQRLMATRFAFTNYHTGTIWGTNPIPGSPHPPVPSLAVPRAWRELLDDLGHAPPAFVVDAAAAGLHDFEGLDLEKYPALWDIIKTQYRHETTTNGGIRIYRHIHS
jgi:hypothetical protein